MEEFKEAAVEFSVRFNADFYDAKKKPSEYISDEELVIELMRKGSVAASDGCTIKLKALWLDGNCPVRTVLYGDEKCLVLKDK